MACDYTVDLTDTYGDGWNGNLVTISVNGTAVLTDITIGTGSTAQFSFSADPGDVVTISYDPSGNWQTENEYTITSDDLNTAVFTDGMGGGTPSGGSFTVGPDCGLAPPSNDDPCQAINLPMNGICDPIPGSVNGATQTAVPDPSCGAFAAQGDVWFETTVGASGLLQIDLTDGGIDANMAIYSGTCDVLVEEGCSVSNTFYSDLIAPGTQIWIRIWDENGSIGSFTICAIEPPPPPENNDPCTAEELTVETECITTIGTTTSAITSSVADPTCIWGAFPGGDVWYTATVPESGFMHVNLFAGGLQDGGIAVYSGIDCNTIDEVACSSDNWNMPTPVVITPADALAGEQVWIRIWEGNNDNPGSFEICLVDEPVLFVDPTTYTPEQLIEEVLITGCLQANNVVYDGDPSAIAYFEGGEGTFGMASGVVMGSGSAVSLTGQGTNTVDYETSQSDIESDLSDISVLNGGASDMHDECIIEFDFIPSSDTTEFDFVFASEEYPNFEHTSYNDVFAFFVSGPGITGSYAGNAINVALVPGTPDPITISTVNGPVADGGSGDNPDYFAEYTGGSAPNFDVGGYTIPITAIMAGLTPCETYHIKFAIADAGDGSLSSYVFFEESSFSSGGDVEMNNVSNVGEQSDIFEGCENYYVFNRLDTSEYALQDTAFILLDYGGTATPGVDYNAMPDTMFIMPGETEFVLYYTAIFDNFTEGNESIIFSLLNGCPCSLTPTNDTIWIKDNYHLDATISDHELICFGESAEITTSINANIDPLLVTYNWSNGGTNSSTIVTPNTTTSYVITITNICESDAVLNSIIQVVPTIDPSFSLSKDTACVGEPIQIAFSGSATQFATYNWSFGDADPSSSDIQDPSAITWSTTGLKDVTLFINDQGCTIESTETIYVKEYSNMSLVNDHTNVNCFGECTGIASVTPNIGISPFSYSWNNGQSEQTAIDLCTGVHNVTVSDYYGCKDTTHIMITEPDELTYSTSAVNASCYGYSDGNASISVSGGVIPYQYLWSNLVASNNIMNVTANTYEVTVIDVNGCQIIEPNIIIEQPSQVNLNIFGEHMTANGLWICIGETETLISSATGGIGPYNYIWESGQQTSTLNVSPQTTTSYAAHAIDATGCLSPQKVVILNVFEPITINTLANPLEICNGEIVNVNINAEGGNGTYVYNISSSSEDQTNSFTMSPTTTQDYVITVSDNCNSPLGIDTFNIEVHENPQVSFLSNTSAGCIPLEVEFENNSSPENSSYLWEFIDIDGSADLVLNENPIYEFSTPGTYHVKLTVASEYNCTSSYTNFNYITAFPRAKAIFQATPSVSTIINPEISFINESTEADIFQWTFGDSDSSTHVSPLHVYPSQVSNYHVELIASNRFGCSDTTSTEISIRDEITFYPPTAFTPDGNNRNEVFKIKSNGMLAEGYHLIVYDRWGMEIFSTNDINEGWNGTKSGKLLQSGIYTWVLIYKDVNESIHEKSGTINLLR